MSAEGGAVAVAEGVESSQLFKPGLDVTTFNKFFNDAGVRLDEYGHKVVNVTDLPPNIYLVVRCYPETFRPGNGAAGKQGGGRGKGGKGSGKQLGETVQMKLVMHPALKDPAKDGTCMWDRENTFATKVNYESFMNNFGWAGLKKAPLPCMGQTAMSDLCSPPESFSAEPFVMMFNGINKEGGYAMFKFFTEHKWAIVFEACSKKRGVSSASAQPSPAAAQVPGEQPASPESPQKKRIRPE